MTAGFLSRRRLSLRRIERQAGQRLDKVEQLRYVRSQMDSMPALLEMRRRRARKIAAMIAAAIGTALLLWQIR